MWLITVSDERCKNLTDRLEFLYMASNFVIFILLDIEEFSSK